MLSLILPKSACWLCIKCYMTETRPEVSTIAKRYSMSHSMLLRYIFEVLMSHWQYKRHKISSDITGYV